MMASHANCTAAVDAEACSGCELCLERCQVDALSMDEDLGVSVVDLHRCIGCGNCVTTCPEEAIRLVKKEREVKPPENLEELYDDLRAAEEQDTILSSLLHPMPDADALSDEELFVLSRKFFAGGHENLIYTIAIAIMELARK